jgi:hypothetical protein
MPFYIMIKFLKVIENFNKITLKSNLAHTQTLLQEACQLAPGITRWAHCINFVNEDDRRSPCGCFGCCFAESFPKNPLTFSCIGLVDRSSTVQEHKPFE